MISHNIILHNIKFNTQRNFRASLYIMVSDSGQHVNCARKYRTKRTYHNLQNYTPDRFTCHHTLLHTHMIKHTKTFLHQPFTFARKYCKRKNCHNIHKYEHSRLPHHSKLIHMTTFMHQTELIQKYIPSNWINLTYVES